MTTSSKEAEDFSIGIVCPLPIEAIAMRSMLDERYPRQSFSSQNTVYDIGRIGKHDVVIASLPMGHTGTAGAASVTKELLLTFPNARVILLVGIGGGVPSIKNDIRLGDVVVGTPDDNHGGVIQYDFGKSLEDGFKITRALNAPSEQLLRYLNAVKMDHMDYAGTDKMEYLKYLTASQSNPLLRNPGLENDLFFESDYTHAGGNDNENCIDCSKSRPQKRSLRDPHFPVIYYGTIASANRVMRSANTRDKFNKEYNGRILCFEMEAAGLMNVTPCLVIRGISDYADSHKRVDKAWHGYASASAAAFAKEYINVIPADRLKGSKKAAETASEGYLPKQMSHWKVPNRLASNFVGRRDELHRIEEIFLSKTHRSSHVVVIRAMGGQGKSQIALEHCSRMREKPLWAIFWIDASSESTVKQDFELISESLKPKDVVLETTESKVNFVKAALDTWPNPWLMIFDNYDNPKVFDNVKDYMPENEQGKIIITSRHTDADFLTGEENRIELGGLSIDDAVDLLLKQGLIKRSGQRVIDYAKVVVLRLGYHALAIAQAGSYICKRKLSLEDFLTHFERKKNEILGKTTPQLSEYRRRMSPSEEEKSLSVFATWELSYQQLQREDIDVEHMADLLTMLAFFDSRDVSENLFQAYCNHEDAAHAIQNPSTSASWTDGQLPRGNSASVTLDPGTTSLAHSQATLQAIGEVYIRDKTKCHYSPGVFLRQYTSKWDTVAYRGVVGTLTQLSLAQAFHKQEDSFCHVSLHPLIRDWIRLRTPFGDCKEYSSIAATCIYRLLNITQHNNGYNMPLSWMQSILAHLEVYNINLDEFFLRTSLPFDKTSDLGSPEICIGNFLNECGQFSKAEVWVRKSLKLRKQTLGAEHPDTLTSINNLATVLKSQGKYQEAEPMYRQTLQLSEQVLGPKHPGTLTSINNLAVVLKSQGKYQEAEPMYRQTLQLREQVLGPEHPDTLTSINNLADVLESQGKYQEAEPMYRQTLQLREQVLGPKHPSTLTSINNLAVVLKSQGKYQEAEPMYRQTLQLSEQVLGPEHPDTLTSINNLADVLESQGKYQEAEPMYRQTLQLREQVLGPKHPSTLTSINNLATVLKSQGKYQEAEPMFRQTLQLREQVLGPKHPSTLTSINNLAVVLKSQGKYQEAEPMYRQTLQLSEQVLGPEHPNTLTSINNLAAVLESQGKYQEAEPMYRQTLQLREQVLGPEHPHTLTSVWCLAHLLHSQRQYDDATTLYQRAYAGFEKALGSGHPYTVLCLKQYTDMLEDRNRAEV